MRATFGISANLSVQAFKLMVSLDLIKSYYPQLYADVQPPFELPPIQLNGGAGTYSYYVGNFVLSMATQGVALTPRQVLGNNPKVIVSYVGGQIAQRVVQWSSQTQLLWRVDALSANPSVVKILSITDSNGIERWHNPADN